MTDLEALVLVLAGAALLIVYVVQWAAIVYATAQANQKLNRTLVVQVNAARWGGFALVATGIVGVFL